MKYVTEHYPLEKATPDSAGYDLYYIGKPWTLEPGEIFKARTGIYIHPESPVLLLGRSSLGAKYGVTLANSVGLIDMDYRGEIIVALINLGWDDYELHGGDRIAQLLPFVDDGVERVEVLDDTLRGAGGFGSTGR